MSDKCVHTELCCVKHGCKCGQEDYPVVLGLKPQSFLCEDCEDEQDGVTMYKRN